MSKETLNIQQLAKLSNIEIQPQQESLLQQELEDIVDMINILQKADTAGVEPLSHPLDQTQPLRQDHVTENNQRELLQQNAPETSEGLFIVPQFVETE